MIQNIIIAVLVVIALIAGVLYGINKEPETEYSFSNNDYMVGINDIRLPLLTGGEKSLSDWKGKIIILNFWATWCVPCREEIPTIIRLQKKWQQKNVQFVGLATDDAASVRDFAKLFDFNYPILLGTAFHTSASMVMGNKAGVLPFTVIISPDFKIIGSHAGVIKEMLLLAKLKKFNINLEP